MKIIVVRHGLTQLNKEERLNGRLDEPLLSQGKRQAEELAAELEPRGIQAIYSSPLKRTMMTAMPIAAKVGKPINVDHRIIEVDIGRFTGQHFTAGKDEFGLNVRELLDSYSYDFKSARGGESSAQVEDRVRSFIEDAKRLPYHTILVVSHGGILRWFNYLCTGEKIGMQPNAKILEFILK